MSYEVVGVFNLDIMREKHMKTLIRAMCVGLMALAIAGVQINLNAQESEGSAAKEKAAKSQKKFPFNGRLKAVDKEAGTVIVGNRTFKRTPQTKYLQDGLEEAKIGEKVGGSYIKEADGTLTVNSIRFGPKPKKEKKENKSADE